MQTQRVVNLQGGISSAGRKFSVRIESPGLRTVRRVNGVPVASEGQPGCGSYLTVKEQGAITTTGVCLSAGGGVGEPSVTCDAGYLKIELVTADGTRAVRVSLSNNRQVTRKVAAILAVDSERRGFYYDAFVGPTPYPVRLSELASNGGIVHGYSLPRITWCKAPSL
jgi:hypothetical protein